MKRSVCFVLTLCSLLSFANYIHAQDNVQQIPPAVISDPPPDPVHPATMAWPDIPSHGAKMYSVIYIAAGEGPHPTVLMLHGFPGNEKNLDLAYSMRRAGWNVLVPFYRGAWGSGGSFSFIHALEDAQASIDFLRDPENVTKFRIDPDHIVLIGHSMGGFVAAYATAHEPKVFAVALISAANLGPASARQRTRDPREFAARWSDNASRLAGTTPDDLMDEVNHHTADWDYTKYVSLLKERPVLVLEADDRNTSDNEALAEDLRKAGDARVTEQHMHTDHPFSDHRIAMQAAIVNWLESITKPTR
jgi:pimeloyl-ACP methyl ester carboxylesterase